MYSRTCFRCHHGFAKAFPESLKLFAQSRWISLVMKQHQFKFFARNGIKANISTAINSWLRMMPECYFQSHWNEVSVSLFPETTHTLLKIFSQYGLIKNRIKTQQEALLFALNYLNSNYSFHSNVFSLKVFAMRLLLSECCFNF